MFQQKQCVGATIITANIAQQKYTDVWFENKGLQDKELGISHFKLLRRIKTASSLWDMKAFRITVKLIHNCF
jgi:hypothetical protein